MSTGACRIKTQLGSYIHRHTSSHLLLITAFFTCVLEHTAKPQTSEKLPDTDIQIGKDTFKQSLKEALGLTG